MSIAGVIQRRGERVTIYRGSDATLPDRSTVRVWLLVASAARVVLEDVGAEKIRTIFGADAQGSVQGWAMIATDLREDDGLEVTSGAHAGQRYLVRRRRALPGSRTAAHQELALEATSEDFAKYGQSAMHAGAGALASRAAGRATLAGGGARVRGTAAGRGALRAGGGKVTATGDNGVPLKYRPGDPITATRGSTARYVDAGLVLSYGPGSALVASRGSEGTYVNQVWP